MRVFNFNKWSFANLLKEKNQTFHFRYNNQTFLCKNKLINNYIIYSSLFSPNSSTVLPFVNSFYHKNLFSLAYSLEKRLVEYHYKDK